MLAYFVNLKQLMFYNVILTRSAMRDDMQLLSCSTISTRQVDKYKCDYPRTIIVLYFQGAQFLRIKLHPQKLSPSIFSVIDASNPGSSMIGEKCFHEMVMQGQSAKYVHLNNLSVGFSHAVCVPGYESELL